MPDQQLEFVTFEQVQEYLKSIDHKGPDRWVVCAAVKTIDGQLICGARHHHCIRMGVGFGFKMSPKADDQGFVDQWNVYMTRQEAFKIAKKNNQIIDAESVKYLFSEDLY